MQNPNLIQPCPARPASVTFLLCSSPRSLYVKLPGFHSDLDSARVDPTSGPLHKLSFLLETVFPRPCPGLPCTVWVSVPRYLLRELSLTHCPSHHSLLVRKREDGHTASPTPPPPSSRSPVALQVQRARIQSLVRELRSHMPSGVAKNMFFFFFFNLNELPVQVGCMILDAWGWCTGTTQRDDMGREEGGGFRMGNTCIPVADSF